MLKKIAVALLILTPSIAYLYIVSQQKDTETQQQPEVPYTPTESVTDLPTTSTKTPDH